MSTKAKTKGNVKNVKNDVLNVINKSKDLLNDESLIDLDLTNLDENNFNDLLNQLSKSTKKQNVSSKIKMYKIEVNKSIRQKIRKKRDFFINNLIHFASVKNDAKIKELIKDFDLFYKETYTLNDYSLNSICANNSDNDTKIKTNVFLTIIKKSKGLK